MTAQNGALVLIKVGNGASPETFATIGGLRVSSMSISNHALDATDVESGIWRELFANAGAQSMTVSGSGMFTNSAAEETLRGYAFAGSVNDYQFLFANGDYISGVFLVTAYERAGNWDSEETYALTLESAGAITFTP